MPTTILVQPPLTISRDVVDYPYHADLAVVQAASVLLAAGREVAVVDAMALKTSGLEDAGERQVLIGAPVWSMPPTCSVRRASSGAGAS